MRHNKSYQTETSIGMQDSKPIPAHFSPFCSVTISHPFFHDSPCKHQNISSQNCVLCFHFVIIYQEDITKLKNTNNCYLSTPFKTSFSLRPKERENTHGMQSFFLQHSCSISVPVSLTQLSKCRISLLDTNLRELKKQMLTSLTVFYSWNEIVNSNSLFLTPLLALQETTLNHSQNTIAKYSSSHIPTS